MQSKTSFFNKTLFRKNLTRFAPVWVVYSLCLIVGVALVYTDNTREQRLYWFASHMATDIPQVLSMVNLVYAPIVAQLLFGDLYNSRMCNAIHALPIRREGWYLTNAVSGICFSLIPTALMAVVSVPLLAGSIVEGAWKIALYLLLYSNLGFLCFYGIAMFCAVCVGNRFTMLAAYGLVNFGAYIAYWLVDTLYTPLLYGVITPSRLAISLTPVLHMSDHTFFEVTDYAELFDLVRSQGKVWAELSAAFSTTGEGWRF